MTARGGLAPHQNPKYLTPQNTANVLAGHADSCQHLGLLLGRYAPRQVIDNDAWDDRGRVKWRDHWLREDVLPRFKVSQPRPAGWQRLLGAVYQRWQAVTAGATRFEAQARGRLVVGLGGKGVLEFGLTLQHVTGLPVIPGSALKGLARTYGLLTIAAELGFHPFSLNQMAKLEDFNKNNKVALRTPLEYLDEALSTLDNKVRDDALANAVQADKVAGKGQGQGDLAQIGSLGDVYRTAFGSQEQGGACIFYDAVVAGLPQNGTLFEADVMTPHFVEYYTTSGEQPPHDAGNPNPITFMTVAAGTTFAFAVGLRPGGDTAAREQAVLWLKDALRELGIGAKTAAGYGVFRILPNGTPPSPATGH